MDIQVCSPAEIRELLAKGRLPLSGVTTLGSAEFRVDEPAPFFGVAMHAGHGVRKEILGIMAVSQQDRLREEDPHTQQFIRNFPIRIIARDSRFEYDLNREPGRSVYSSVRGIWGLKVWERKQSPRERQRTLARHSEFHELVDVVAEYLLPIFGRIRVFDMHAYCYQRDKRQLWYQDPRPEINIGTRAVDRRRFGGFIDQFIAQLSQLMIDDRPLRVSENEIFGGGYLSRRLSRNHPDRVLVLALEYKKLFMDEWTGELYQDKLELLVRDFERAVSKTEIKQ